MARTIAVRAEPSVLKWLIESSGWAREDIDKRLKTSTQNIGKMESGEKKPSFRQLEELSVIFKRPVASFLLSKPLAEKPKPKDYRWGNERISPEDEFPQ
jgi:ribosome-binding protein aMBF1 (putative translation factor)